MVGFGVWGLEFRVRVEQLRFSFFRDLHLVVLTRQKTSEVCCTFRLGILASTLTLSPRLQGNERNQSTNIKPQKAVLASWTLGPFSKVGQEFVLLRSHVEKSLVAGQALRLSWGLEF